MVSVSGIYIIINTKSKKIYVGQSYDIKMRWRKHKSRLERSNHDNIHLQSAWNKYGADTFQFKILEYCPVEQLDIREQHFLDIYIPQGVCYNIAKDVQGSMRGIPRSEETKRRISASKMGVKRAPFSEEARRNIADSARGRNQSDESRRKKSEAAKRRSPMSQETRQKISDANKKRPPPSDETRQKISKANSGHVVTDEQKRKISEANKGSKRTPEQRIKMGEARKLKNKLRRLASTDESIKE